MPERCQYVLIDDTGWELFSSRWRASVLDTDLAAGPAAAIRCFRDQEGPTGWYDWSEAAALVDEPNRVLLLFITYAHLKQFAHRAALLAVLARTWPGWEVRWAYDGLDDLVTYVGEDRRIARGWGQLDLIMPLEDDDDEIDQLVTVRDAAGERAYAFYEQVNDLLHYGPEMPELLPAEARITACRFPRGGLHIDFLRRELGLWGFDPLDGLADRLPAAWPGWRIEFWQDRYQEHLKRCPIPVADWEFSAGLDILADRLAIAGSYAEPAERTRLAEVIAMLSSGH